MRNWIALAREHKPKMIVAGASAYSRIIDFPRMAEIARSVGALFFVDMAHIAGLVAGGMHPCPSTAPADFVLHHPRTKRCVDHVTAACVLCKQQFANELDRIHLPRHAGRPSDAYHRRQGGVPEGSRRSRLPRIR